VPSGEKRTTRYISEWPPMPSRNANGNAPPGISVAPM
jgi:hypothetical protein